MFESCSAQRATSTAVLALLVVVSLASCRSRETRDQFIASGDRYVQKKQYAEAIIEYRNAIAKDPRHGPLRTKLADAYWANNDASGAAAEYLKAAELMPNDTAAQLKRLKMLLLGRRLEEVREDSEKLLEREPKNVEAHLLHANAMAGLKEYAHALAEIRQAILLDPTNSGEYYISLGAVQLLANNPEEAEASFRMGAAANPNSVAAQLVQAANDWVHGRVTEAEQAFKRTIALDPTNPAANRALAVFYLGSNREGEAEQHLLAYVKASPTTPVRLTLADYYIKMKRIDDATKILHVVEKDREGFGEARSRLATIAYDAGRTAEGHKIIDEALAHDPNSVPMLLTKANFLIVEQKTSDALVRLRAAVVAGPRSVPAHYTLGVVDAREGNYSDAIREFKEVLRIDPQSTDAQLALAHLNLVTGESSDALGFADQASKGRPRDPGARALLLRALIQQGNVKRASEEVASFVAAFPKRAEAHTLAGTVALLRKEPVAARQAFERALALDPEAVEPLDGIVGIEISGGNVAKARALVEQRLAVRSDTPALLLLAGRTYYETGQPDKAQAPLRKALEIDKSNPNLYMLLGQVYLALRQTDQARAEFEEILRRDPKSIPAQTMVALILEMQNKPLEAQKAYEKVLAIDPRAAVAANNLAWLYATEGGNLDLALELARVAVRQMPQLAVSNDTLGWVLYKKGLTLEAIPPLELGVSKDPRNPMHRYHVGLAYARVGEAEHARQALTEALRLKSDFEGAADAKRVLASLSR